MRRRPRPTPIAISKPKTQDVVLNRFGTTRYWIDGSRYRTSPVSEGHWPIFRLKFAMVYVNITHLFVAVYESYGGWESNTGDGRRYAGVKAGVGYGFGRDIAGDDTS